MRIRSETRPIERLQLEDRIVLSMEVTARVVGIMESRTADGVLEYIVEYDDIAVPAETGTMVYTAAHPVLAVPR